MKENSTTRFDKEKELLIHLYELIRSKSPLDDLKEHTSLDEKRRAIRIYMEHPVKITITEPSGQIRALEGNSVNLSESGILVNIMLKISHWEQMEPQIKKAALNYRFIEPEELAGDNIKGKVRRFVKKNGTTDQKIKIELGIQIQHSSKSFDEKFNILQYINNLLVKSINNDIAHIEKIKENRKLSEDEQNIYDFLLNEYTDRR